MMLEVLVYIGFAVSIAVLFCMNTNRLNEIEELKAKCKQPSSNLDLEFLKIKLNSTESRLELLYERVEWVRKNTASYGYVHEIENKVEAYFKGLNAKPKAKKK